MRRFKLLTFLPGGRTTRRVIEARTHDEAWGLAVIQARRAEARDFYLTEA